MTDEEIMAYVDGEMLPLDRLRFEKRLRTDPALAESVRRHRALRDSVAGHFAPIAQEPVPDRLAATLAQPSNVIALPGRAPAKTSYVRAAAALAAALVAGVMLGQQLPDAKKSPVSDRAGILVAQGDLAEALDRQLASAPSGAYRIGVSFATGTEGRLCRTFVGPAGSGIGCREPSGWTVQRYVAGHRSGGGAYRQAGSAEAAIMAQAQDMMTGEPLDAAAERRARDSGWLARRK
ncbi:MAG: anti-sigma factor [Rhizorhabdus sp.]|uniref:anti-sigma factor family protein n=1 Tax=Rhizorhabdus sp. TaxID=1968843 RepID=UPI001B79DACC|nr:anti-sigma factor [Rhizorhabdus sp.]MBP8231700.1 anti-sigma factor [Rhizorhabdus sp.]